MHLKTLYIYMEMDNTLLYNYGLKEANNEYYKHLQMDKNKNTTLSKLIGGI